MMIRSDTTYAPHPLPPVHWTRGIGWGALALVAAVLPVGCRSPVLWIEAAVTEVQWNRDGFLLNGSGRTFKYIFRRNRAEGRLTLWNDYAQKAKYIDYGMDGKVDRIATRGGECKRGAPGKEALFAHADKTWDRCTKEMSVAKYVKKWTAAGPDGFAVLSGVGSY